MITLIKWSVAIIFAFFMTACGGGGQGQGGDSLPADTPSDQSTAITFESLSLNLSYLEGSTPDAISVRVMSSKSFNTLPYVRISVSGQGFDAKVVSSLSNGDAVLNLQPTLGLPNGTYQGSVTLQVCADESCSLAFQGASKTFPYTVQVWPRMSTKVNVVSLAVAENGPPVEYLLNVSATNPDLVVEAIPSDQIASWLRVEKVSNLAFRLFASPGRLNSGLYEGEVKLSTSDGEQTLSVPVSLVVNTGMLVSPVHATTLNAATTEPDTHGDVRIDAAPGVNFRWNASTSTPWLKLDQTFGKPGESVRWHLDLALIDNLLNKATHEGVIQIASEDDTLSKASIRILIHKRLPEVLTISPFAVESNVVNTVYLRGSGFNAIDDLAKNVRIGGVAPTNIKRLNDTSLLLTMPGLSAGSYSVKLHKMDAFRPTYQKYKTYDGYKFPYAEVSTSASKDDQLPPPDAIEYDPTLKAVTIQHVLNVGQYYERAQMREIVQYIWNGSQWVISKRSTPFFGSPGMGVSADGNKFVTHRLIDRQGSEIKTFDVQTLSQIDRFEVNAFAHMPYERKKITITNDNRLLVFGETYGKYDFIALKSGIFPPSPTPRDESTGPLYLREPDMAISADGEHIYLLQNYRPPEPAPLWRFGASDTGTSLTSFPGISGIGGIWVNRDGSRFFLGHDVYDSPANKIGTLDVDNLLWGTAVIYGRTNSPDGLWQYVLAYPATDTAPSPDSIEPSSPLLKPRIYVFDLRKAGPDGKFKPSGYFELNQYPGCRRYRFVTDPPPCTIVRMTVSQDQKTIFLMGSKFLISTPIPSSLIN